MGLRFTTIVCSQTGKGHREGLLLFFKDSFIILFRCSSVHMDMWRSEVNLMCCSSGTIGGFEPRSLIESGGRLFLSHSTSTEHRDFRNLSILKAPACTSKPEC